MRPAAHAHHTLSGSCSESLGSPSSQDGTEESDRLVAAGVDRVVDEGSEHAADAALTVDEADDVTGAGAAAGRATDAGEQVLVCMTAYRLLSLRLWGD